VPRVAPAFDTISFLSDYGLEDEFVGVVKGVIRSIAPHAAVIDVCHQVPAHDVRAGSLTLARSIQYLPPGVVLAVVDPGVGGARRAVAVEVGGGESDEGDGEDVTSVLVGPDNGLLAPAVTLAGGARRVVSLTDADYHLPAPGPTFAGRDVFGPVAAHLCNGVPLDALGEPVDPFSLMPGVVPLSRVEDGRVVGEVLWVDRFGNVQLNVDPDEAEPLGTHVLLRSGDRSRVAVRATTFSDLRTGQVGLVVDSYGLMTVVLNRRSAADELHLGPGDAVSLEPAPD
jgi:S-adenosylmethionine hydrolase